MIPLLTERLRLRALIPDDLGFVRRLHANPDLIRFIPSAITPNEAAAHRHLDRFMSLVNHPVQGFSLIELRGSGDDDRAVPGTAVGLIMVKPIPSSGGGAATVLEIGWRQVAEHCGHGYVTEAARAVLNAVHDAGVERIVAVADPENVASQRVAARIGMERVGSSTEFYDTTTVLFLSTRSRGPRATWLPAGWELLPAGESAFPGPLRDRLAAAILTGGKRATTALLADYKADSRTRLPAPGDRELVLDSAGTPACVIGIVDVDVVPLAEVAPPHALGEGEGYEDVAERREGHERFWTSPEYREWLGSLGAEPPAVDDDTPVVCTRFEVVARRPGTRVGSGEAEWRKRTTLSTDDPSTRTPLTSAPAGLSRPHCGPWIQAKGSWSGSVRGSYSIRSTTARIRSAPWSWPMSAAAMSMPAATPEEVHRSPSWTHRARGSHATEEPNPLAQEKDRLLLVAR